MRLKFLPRSWFYENVDKHQILISNKVVDIENLCFQLANRQLSFSVMILDDKTEPHDHYIDIGIGKSSL